MASGPSPFEGKAAARATFVPQDKSSSQLPNDLDRYGRILDEVELNSNWETPKC